MKLQIRTLLENDYKNVFHLWSTINGFAIRKIEDSKKGIIKFLNRNPNLSIVAALDNKIIGSILVGHDGRQASLYHVCVHKDYRGRGIAKLMVDEAIKRLKKEKITKIQIVAFKENELGNNFWSNNNWNKRDDFNVYDFILNEKNIIKINKK